MFGLEDKKRRKGSNEFIFELEKEFRDPQKGPKIKTLLEDRIQKIKKILRTGEDKEEFEQYGVILHGYTSVVKVMIRSLAQKYKKS